MNTHTATALYLDPWSGPVLAFVAPFKTKRNGERVTRYRWQRADGLHCCGVVYRTPEAAVAAKRCDRRFREARS